jgi:DNA-binding FadR family transcriptional regulator
MVTELPDSRLAYRTIREKNLNGTGVAGNRFLGKDLPKKNPKRTAPPRRLGAAVRLSDAAEFKDLCGARQALETYAAGLAAQQRTEDQLRELRRPLQAMRRTLDRIRGEAIIPSLLDALVRDDLRFHLIIVEIAGNAWLKQEILRLRVLPCVIATALKSEPIHTLDEHRGVQASHEAIFDAIARGDSAEAKSAMERHLEGNLGRLRR